MKKRIFALLLCGILVFSSVAMGETITIKKTISSQERGWDIDPAEWMCEYTKGIIVHKTVIIDAEPSDWGTMSSNGVLMMDGGYIGTIKAKHYIYKVVEGKKVQQAMRVFIFKIVPQNVNVKKVFMLEPGAMQIRWEKVEGADWYEVTIGKGKETLKTRKTFKTDATFYRLAVGKYWFTVKAVTDVWGVQLKSKSATKVTQLMTK